MKNNTQFTEMKEIVQTLKKWAAEYYEQDAPSVSDSTYDALYDRLVKLERETGMVLPDSPTKKVGGTPSKKFIKYRHKNRLYSMDKVQSLSELEQWVERLTEKYGKLLFTVEYKYDGLNISLTYDKGKLIRAVTRGNGIEGEIVTEQIKTIKNVPQSILYDGEIEIQGEGYITLSALKQFNENNPSETLKNARNGAAGAIRNLDPTITQKRNLSMVLYSLGYGEIPEVGSQNSLVSFFKENGFSTNDLYENASCFADIKEIIQREEKHRDSLDFLIDGIVIKVNDFALREEIGYTEKFPKWAVAYKFEAEEAVTKLKSVEWNVGRTGKITPLAHLEPVELCGATIKRATLNNIGDIERKGIKLGSEVYIRRSNDVIPEILGIAADCDTSKTIAIPDICPSCGAETEFYGAHLYCPNKTGCKAQIVGRIVHFCGRNACNIDGISEKTVLQMVERLNIKDPSDLFAITAEQLSLLDSFKEKKINNFFNALSGVKNVALANFIFSLGIDNVGLKTAKDLAERYGAIDELKKATLQELIDIEDIGETVASDIVEFFSSNDNLEMLERLKSFGIDPVYSKNSVSDVFKDLRFVLTGSLSEFSRNQAAKLIEERGGKTLSAVSKNVNIVVAGEEAGSKLQKALSLGLEIWDEERFKAELNK